MSRCPPQYGSWTEQGYRRPGEARKLGIPVVASARHQLRPRLVDYPVPGDDAIRRGLHRVIADAVAED